MGVWDLVDFEDMKVFGFRRTSSGDVDIEIVEEEEVL